MPGWTFEKGLHDLGNGCWAYLQPDGGWGWSNAGLIADHGETLLVDWGMAKRLPPKVEASVPTEAQHSASLPPDCWTGARPPAIQPAWITSQKLICKLLPSWKTAS